MIACVGDVHGDWNEFEEIIEEIPEDVPIIQVGDLGLHWLGQKHDRPKLKRPLFWLDGNHDHFPTFYHCTEPTEVAPNLIYVPRGTVLDLDGRKVGFLGGGESRDKARRVEGVSWFREESITYSEWF